MNETKTLNITIKELLGAKTAISTKDGDKLFQRIDKALTNNAKVCVDFKDIKLITTAFLNAGVGQLCGKYNGEVLNQKLKFSNIENIDLVMLKKVIETSKKYFKDRKFFDDSVKRVLEDDH